MNLRTLLTAPPQPLNPWLRDGFLIFCLVLLGWHLRWVIQHAGMRGHETLGLVLIALLLNHLAFRFFWPRTVMIGLRIVACVWIAFTFCYWLRLLPGQA